MVSSEAPAEMDVPERVAVVAEQADDRDELVHACVAEGYQATPLATAEMLLERCRDAVPLVVMMLEAHGRTLDLCGEIRMSEVFRSSSILMVTRDAPEPEQAAAALLAGADDYCSMLQRYRAELRARLRVHLRNHRLRAAVDRLRGERNHLRVRATVDSLTGALGRRALSDCVEQGLAAGVPFAVLFVDVDHFKSVNDTFGHAVGDVALRRVAEALSRGRRTGDVCGRYGGEEFVLVVNHVSREQAVSVAERHRQAVARLRLVDAGGPERLTASFGVAWFDPECPDPSVEAIFKRADAALYRAKRAGRDRVELAEPRRDTAPSRLCVGSSEPGPTYVLGESPDAHGPLPTRILGRGDSVAPDPREEVT